MLQVDGFDIKPVKNNNGLINGILLQKNNRHLHLRFTEEAQNRLLVPMKNSKVEIGIASLFIDDRVSCFNATCEDSRCFLCLLNVRESANRQDAKDIADKLSGMDRNKLLFLLNVADKENSNGL